MTPRRCLYIFAGLAATSSILEPLLPVRFRDGTMIDPKPGPLRRLHAVTLVLASAETCSAWLEAIMVIHLPCPEVGTMIHANP